MQAFFDVVLPVFGLIFTGLLAGRFGVLGQNLRALFDRRRGMEMMWISSVKLVIQPLATWVVGSLLGLPPFWLASAVISAAFPAGATAFVIAQRYKIYIERTSATILVSTVLSLLTPSAVMAMLDPKP